MNAALKTVFGVDVSVNAIEQRLRAENADRDDVNMVLSLRSIAEEIIRDEIAGAVEMSPEARRIFIHPGREACLGMIKPAVHFDRVGRRTQAMPHRRNDSGYFWSGDVVYILDHNVVVTCIIPDANQVDSLFRVMPETGRHEAPRRSIVKAVQEAASLKEPVSQVIAIRPTGSAKPKKEEEKHFKREAPPTAKWLGKEDAKWLVLVVDDLEDSLDQIRRAIALIRKEAGDSSLAVHVERSDCRTTKAIHKKLGFAKDFRVKDLPAMPAIDWRKCREDLPNTARKWWAEMLDAGQSLGKLVCVVTPETARSILEIAAGSSDASWRRDREVTKAGTLLKIKCLSVATRVERDSF
ncbi:MAG: hypothetical protein WC551_05745 [Patescibacteria group bacterium]